MSIQFHAQPAELPPVLIAGLAQSASILAVRYRPFLTSPVRDELQASAALDDQAVGEFNMVVGDPRTEGATSDDDLLRRHPGALLLQIGRETERGLRESWLTCKEASGEDYARWRHVANSLRKITMAGAIARNPRSGATGQMRNHRHTEGARRLASQGLAILPVAGDAQVELCASPITKERGKR